MSKAPALPERTPPVRFRKLIPTSWIKIELKEGKNRQIRRMMAAIGFPVLRLVRVQIEDLRLGKLQPGEYQEYPAKELFKLLKIEAAPLQKTAKPTESKSIDKKSGIKKIGGKKVKKGGESGWKSVPKKQTVKRK